MFSKAFAFGLLYQRESCRHVSSLSDILVGRYSGVVAGALADNFVPTCRKIHISKLRICDPNPRQWQGIVFV